MLKIRGSEIQQDLGELLMECAGPYAVPFVPEALEIDYDGETAGGAFLNALAAQYFDLRKVAIYGGTNEVQKNLISKSVLGSLAMDFNYSEEQQMLADTLARFVADAYPLDARRRLVATKPGFSPDYWQQFAELGLLGLNVPGTVRRTQWHACGYVDRHAGIRPRAGARAVFVDGRARRRVALDGRQRAAKIELVASHRRGIQTSCTRHAGA